MCFCWNPVGNLVWGLFLQSDWSILLPAVRLCGSCYKTVFFSCELIITLYDFEYWGSCLNRRSQKVLPSYSHKMFSGKINFFFRKCSTGKLSAALEHVLLCLTKWKFCYREHYVCVILCYHMTCFSKWMFCGVVGHLLTKVICTSSLPWLVLIWDSMLLTACRDCVYSLLTVSCSFRAKLNSILAVLKGILVLGSSALVCTDSLLFKYVCLVLCAFKIWQVVALFLLSV